MQNKLKTLIHRFQRTMIPKQEKKNKEKSLPDTSQDKEKPFKEAIEMPTMEARGQQKKKYQYAKKKKMLYPEKNIFQE